MTDIHALPDSHPLKPLEARMLQMADDMGPLKVHGGNFVAALRVYATEHPGLVDDTRHCPVCDSAIATGDGGLLWSNRHQRAVCPDCAKEAE